MPEAVVEIARRLEDQGFETWCVGGAVRDTLLGHPRGDWDLATAARPPQVRKLFRRTYPIGIEFGTVGVRGSDDQVYEVTGFRRDVSTDGRHAVIEYADTLEEDLARRDFTINAIAYHPIRREWRDPHGGLGDLEAGVLRAVGDAATRFDEDYLRILRGLRFAGRFGLEIEPATWRAMRERAPQLPRLSGERVREELLKVMADPKPSATLEWYRQAGVLPVLYPEMGANGAEWSRRLAAVDAVARSRPFLRAVLWLSGVPDPEALEGLLRRHRFSNAEVDTARTLLSTLALPLPEPDDPRGTRRWLSAVGDRTVQDTLRLHAAAARSRGNKVAPLARTMRAILRVWRARPPLTVADLAIDGDDLKALGLQPGPHFAEILNGCLERVLDDPGMNTREALMPYVKERWMS